MKKKRRLKIAHPGLLALSLILTLLLALAFSVYTAPKFARKKVIAMLSDPDPKRRERALNYLIQRVDSSGDAFDPDLLADAISHLGEADDKTFLELVYALDSAGAWRQPTIPSSPWLRWIESLSRESNPNAHVVAAQELGFTSELLRLPEGAALLEKLGNSSHDDTRYNALISAAIAMSKPPVSPTIERVFSRALNDKNPEIARQAWIFLGLAATDSSRLMELRKIAADAAQQFLAIAKENAASTQPGSVLHPRVFQSLIWAQARLQVEWVAPPADILASKPPFTPAHASSMMYALAQHPTDENTRLIADTLALGPEAVNESNYTLFWRAVLALPLPAPASQPADAATQPASRASVFKPFFSTDPNNAALRAISLAAGYRLGVRVPKLPELSDYWSQLATLAAVESSRLAIRDLPINEWIGAPDVLRIMAVRAVAAPSPDDLYPTFASPEPTIRDLACIVAAERFTPAQNAALVRRALSDFDDHAKMTGAILAGLTGQSVDFLADRHSKEDQWAVKQVMSLGLWMHGKMPEMSETALALLTRDDVPRTTLLFAMLHCQMPQAKEYLFNPRGEPALNLRDLFDQKRWWPVLRRYLPDDAPPFWIWADVELDEFQVDVLRNWYLIYDRDVKAAEKKK